MMMMKTSFVLWCLWSTATAFTSPPSNALTLPDTVRSSSSSLAMTGFSLDGQENLVAAGAALVAAVAGFGAMNKDEDGTKNSKKAQQASKEVEKVDLSIPYSAAALLTFDTMGGSKDDKKAFAKFEKLYNEHAVTIVKSKKAARDNMVTMKAFEDQINSIEKEMSSLVS